MSESYSVGLDIGTTKIVVIVGQRNQFNKVKVLGLGKSQSLGVHRGVVNNITQTIQSIKIAVDEAKSKCTVSLLKQVAAENEDDGTNVCGWKGNGFFAAIFCLATMR